MADQTTVKISPVKEIQDIEYCTNAGAKNVPPGVIDFPETSELKDQHQAVIRSSSALQSGQNYPHSAFSTPAPKSGISKTGFSSALTPILKQLNIHNCSSPPKPVNSSELKAPSLSFCDTLANSQRLSATNQSFNTNATRTLSRQSLVDANSPMSWLDDESLPEITFLDVTCDTTEQLSKNDPALNDSMPSTPVRPGAIHTFNSPMPLNNKNPDVIQSKGAETFCPQTSSLNGKPIYKKIGARTVSEMSSNHPHASQHKHPSRVFDATQDYSQAAEVSKGETMAEKRSMMADVPESVDAPLRWLDDRYFPEITLLDVTQDLDFSSKVEMTPLKVKQDVPVSSLQNNLPSSALGEGAETVPSTQDSEISRTLDANSIDTTKSLCEQPDKDIVNNTPTTSLGVTQDISMNSALEDSRPSLESSGPRTAVIQTSVEGTPNIHPINVTQDISCSSNMSVHYGASHTEHTQCNTSSQNVTSEAHCDLEATSAKVKVNGQELLTSQLSSMLSEHSSKPTGSGNSTFITNPHANQMTSVLADNTGQILSPQNKTQDLSPSDGSSLKSQEDVNHQPTTESKNNNESSLQNFSSGMPRDLQNKTFEKLQKSTGSTIVGEDGASNMSNQKNTFTMTSKVNVTVTVLETSSSDSHHSALDNPDTNTSENKATTFNFDSILDFRDALLTSTPMVTSKMFNFSTEREEGKFMAAQKKLYRDGPSKADHQVQAGVPPKTLCDRKTFSIQPPAKSILPLKAPSQLLRYKSTSALPGRPDPPVSGLPVTRQKTQAAALRKTDPSQVVGYEQD